MADLVKKGIIACGDDEQLQQIQAKVPVVYYGFGPTNDFQAQNVTETEEGKEFDVFVRNTYYDRFTIPMYGDHHIHNELSVIAIYLYVDYTVKEIQNISMF